MADMRYYKAAAGIMAAALCVLALYTPMRWSRGEGTGFVEQRVILETPSAHISLPQVIGLGAQMDRQINDRIDEAVNLPVLLEAAQSGQARARYCASLVGQVLCMDVMAFCASEQTGVVQTRTILNVDSRDGRFYALKDLFLPRSREAAYRTIAQALEETAREAGVSFDGTIPQAFCLNENNLRLLCQPGLCAPYERGYVLVEVPLARLEPYLNFGGACLEALTTKSLDETAGLVL